MSFLRDCYGRVMGLPWEYGFSVGLSQEYRSKWDSMGLDIYETMLFPWDSHETPMTLKCSPANSMGWDIHGPPMGR